MNNYKNDKQGSNNNLNPALVGSIQKFSVEDGPGIRTTVFLKGCPLNCKWCHNPELIDINQQLIQSPNNCIGCGYCQKTCPEGAIDITRAKGVVIERDRCVLCLKCADDCFANALRPVASEMTIEEILMMCSQDKGFYDNTGGGITISGGEILMHGDFVSRLIDEAAAREINVCLDTSGFGDPELLLELAAKDNVTDILYDMKSIDDNVHREYTKVGNAIIIDNLRMLMNCECTAGKVTMRMPLIKGINDSDEIIAASCELYEELGIKKVTLLPYHNLGISKKRNIGGSQQEFEAPADNHVEKIAKYFRKRLGAAVEIMGKL